MINSLTILERYLLDLLPIAISWKDVNSKYLGCNIYHAKHAGFLKPDEVIGKYDSDMIWKINASGYVKDDKEIMTTGIAKLDYIEHRDYNDEIFTVRTSKIPLKNDGIIVGVLVVWLDITKKTIV